MTIDLLWKTLADVLSSQELQVYFDKNGKDIEIKSIFTDVSKLNL